MSMTSLPPHAMVNQYGDLFYPDSLEDAAHFAEHHPAWPVLPRSFPWAVVLQEIDPALLKLLQQPWSELPPELR